MPISASPWICITSRGEVDPQAFTLMGATSKEGDSSKIGYFGTGAKYALAYLLRNNIPFHIYSGKREIDIRVKRTNFRGTELDVIHVDGKPTSLTTRLGPDWQPWWIIREFYCNALDEGEASIHLGQIAPEADTTSIYIANQPPFREILEPHTFNKFFAEKLKVLDENEYGRIYELPQGSRGEGYFYRKGIRCFEPNNSTAFAYDFNDLQINESRVATYHWEVYESMWRLLFACSSPEVVSRVLHIQHDKHYCENNAGGIISLPTSKEFNPVGWEPAVRGKLFTTPSMLLLLNTIEMAEAIVVSDQLFEQLRLRFGDIIRTPNVSRFGDTAYLELERVRPDLLETLQRAKNLLAKAGICIDEYPVSVVRFANKDIRGLADRSVDRICIAERTLVQGLQYTTETLIEEFTHLRYGVNDCTRDMQNALLEQFVSYILNQQEGV